METVFWIAIAPVLLVFYAAPAVLAYRRGYPQWRGLLVLVVLVGWTPVGCAAAWIWFAKMQRRARSGSTAPAPLQRWED